MRTTISLDDELLAKAQQYTGLTEKSAIVREGLKALTAREAARRLAKLGGSQPGFKAPRRRPMSEWFSSTRRSGRITSIVAMHGYKRISDPISSRFTLS